MLHFEFQNARVPLRKFQSKFRNFLFKKNLKKGSDIMATKNTKKNSENGTEKTQKSVSENEKSTQKNDVSKTQKIRSFRSLKLKVLKGQKLENWELEKINERIVFLKSEVEHLKSKLTLAKQDLEELEIIIKFHK